MKVLVIGGTGPIGGDAALYLASKGRDVTISSRTPPKPGAGLEALDWLPGDFQKNTYTEEMLSAFDAVVFAAGSDLRHVPPGDDADEHYLKVNGEAVPACAATAKSAGVKCFIHVGSFYPQVVPEMLETDAYVRSRHLADKLVCDLSDNTFRAMSLNAPFVVGCPPGMKNDMFAAYVGYARGLHPQIDLFGPAGGSNFMSVRSLSQAIDGALERGAGGASYLLGDENLTFAEFFQVFFAAAGRQRELPSLDREHAMLPDIAIIPGRGSVVSYDPDPDETALLGYDRGDVARAVASLVKDFDEQFPPVAPVQLSPAAAPEPELKRLAELYARAVDSNDAAMLDEILSEDIVIEGPGFKVEGKDEARAIPGNLEQFFLKTQHQVYQQLAEVSGDRAIGETYCTAHHVLFPDAHAGDRVLTWHIRYQDEFTNTGGGWLFKKRSLIADWMEVRPVSTPQV